MIIPRESLGEFITELLCGWISLGHSEWTKAVGHVLCDFTGRTIGSCVCRFRGQWNSLKLELYVHRAAAKEKKKSKTASNWPIIGNLRTEFSVPARAEQTENWGRRCGVTSWENDICTGERVTGEEWGETWQAEAACHRAAEDRSKLWLIPGVKGRDQDELLSSPCLSFYEEEFSLL